MTGGRAKRAYLFEAGSFSCAFVQSPLRGMWMRTDPAVVLAACDDCKAKQCEPCKGKNGMSHNWVHRARKEQAAAMRPEEPKVVIVAGIGGKAVPALARPAAPRRTRAGGGASGS